MPNSLDLVKLLEKKDTPIDARELINRALSSTNSYIDRRQQNSSSPVGRSLSSVSQSSQLNSAPLAGNDVQNLVQSMAASQYGWSGPEWDALYDLVSRESGWDPYADNPSSSAAGLFQFLDSTRRNYGITRDSPLEAQIAAGLRYIADRYQTPTGALSHWQSRVPINGRDVGHWY